MCVYVRMYLHCMSTASYPLWYFDSLLYVSWHAATKGIHLTECSFTRHWQQLHHMSPTHLHMRMYNRQRPLMPVTCMGCLVYMVLLTLVAVVVLQALRPIVGQPLHGPPNLCGVSLSWLFVVLQVRESVLSRVREATQEVTLSDVVYFELIPNVVWVLRRWCECEGGVNVKKVVWVWKRWWWCEGGGVSVKGMAWVCKCSV